MAALRDLHLVLFFTRGVSLATWQRLGTLDRELELYERLRPHLRAITFVTHGGREDRALAERLAAGRGRDGGIALVCNRWGLPLRLQHRLVSDLLPRRWRGPTVVKTNQIPGAELALRAARRAGTAFVARAGYLPSLNAACARGADSDAAREALALERAVFGPATRVVVTTDTLREHVIEAHALDPGRVRVVPNYVDTGIFRPAARPLPETRRVCYVGRLDETDKNLKALLDALAGLDVDLQLIGSGPSEGDLRSQAARLGLSAHFLGRRTHREVADHLRSGAVFVLPSRYEGHPKALLEAMACGAAVLGTDVPGIRDVVRQRVTGLLCDTAPESLRAGLRELLDDDDLRERLGCAARAWALEHVALDRVVERELAWLRELAETGACGA